MQGIEVLFVAGFGPIVDHAAESATFYRDTLGLPVKEIAPGYLAGEEIDGVKHFGLWPLSGAAQSCFGSPEWPADVPRPQAGVEFEVADLAAATAALKTRGYRLLVENKEEPWGQTVTRLLGPEGMLVGLTITPSMRS